MVNMTDPLQWYAYDEGEARGVGVRTCLRALTAAD
jgi:hypothetical protein